MFSVYIQNWKQTTGSIDTSWSLMFTVPLSGMDKCPLSDPVVKSSQDLADSFDFSMETNSPYYDAMIQLKTLFRIEYDGDVIFFGRVKSISDTKIIKNRRVHCEGAFAFTNDSHYEGIKESKLKKITWSEYLNKILANHNNYFSGSGVYDVMKRIYRGTVSFTPVSESRKFEPTSWTQTSSLLTDLASNYGGHFRLRYNKSDSKLYLDWYKYYWRDLGNNRPKVAVGKDILDISSDSDGDSAFSHVIPIGSSSSNGNPIYIDGCSYTDKNGNKKTHSGKIFPVSLISSLYSDSQINDDFHNVSEYSNAQSDLTKIYITQSFPNANNKTKLWNYTKDWVKNNFFGLAKTFSIRVMDFHTIDSTVPKILNGECVDIEYLDIENGVKVTKIVKRICQSVQYNLLHPDNTNYTFGVPDDRLNAEYGSRSKSKKSDPITKKTPSAPKKPTEDDKDVLNFTYIHSLIATSEGSSRYCGADAAASFRKNGEINGVTQCYDPDRVGGAPIQSNPDYVMRVRIVGKITHGGGAIRWVCVSEQHGVLAIDATGVPPRPVAFWYQRSSPEKNGDFKYTTNDPLIVTENPDTGEKTIEVVGSENLEDPHTIMIKPSEVNKVDGKDKTKGTMVVGYDLTGDKDWCIKLNYPIRYTDKNNKTQVAVGGVSAKDFHVDTIPSFKTKLAIVDALVADVVHTNDLDAINAFIKDLQSDTARIELLSARNMYCSGLAALNRVNTNHLDANVVQSRSFHYISGNNDAYTENCFDRVTAEDLGDGRWKISFNTPSRRYNRGSVHSVTIGPIAT